MGVTTPGVIHGRRSKLSKLDIQPFIAIFVDEMRYMYHVGLPGPRQPALDSRFLCRARVVQCISDIRGEEKVLLTKSTPAFYGCFYRWIVGYRACRKTVYCGHHTALPLNHPSRPRSAALLP
jgi:hypothetical protein